MDQFREKEAGCAPPPFCSRGFPPPVSRITYRLTSTRARHFWNSQPIVRRLLRWCNPQWSPQA